MPRANSDAHPSRILIPLRGGYIVDARVVERLLDLERRGATFALLPPPGRFRVDPPSVLTEDDIRFLRQHRDEARRVIEYTEQMSQEPLP